MVIGVAVICVGALRLKRVRLGVMTCEKGQVEVYEFGVDFEESLKLSFGLAFFASSVVL
jgi:hypothetical protein